jgi:hypothetical protein
MLQSERLPVSIPDEVIDFFNLSNLSCHSIAMDLTQPLTEMNTRKSFLAGGLKCGRRVRLTSTPSMSLLSRKMWEPRTCRLPRPVTGISLPLLTYIKRQISRILYVSILYTAALCHRNRSRNLQLLTLHTAREDRRKRTGGKNYKFCKVKLGKRSLWSSSILGVRLFSEDISVS